MTTDKTMTVGRTSNAPSLNDYPTFLWSADKVDPCVWWFRHITAEKEMEII